MVAKTSEPGQVNGRGWRQRGSIGRRGGNNVASCWYRGDRPQPHLVHQGMIVVKLGGRQECSILIGMTRPEGGNLTCTAYQEMRSQEERAKDLAVKQEEYRKKILESSTHSPCGVGRQCWRMSVPTVLVPL